jgi:hypothetical protein
MYDVSCYSKRRAGPAQMDRINRRDTQRRRRNRIYQTPFVVSRVYIYNVRKFIIFSLPTRLSTDV